MGGSRRVARKFAEIIDDVSDQWWFIALVTLLAVLVILFLLSVTRTLLRYR